MGELFIFQSKKVATCKCESFPLIEVTSLATQLLSGDQKTSDEAHFYVCQQGGEGHSILIFVHGHIRLCFTVPLHDMDDIAISQSS